jgi:hypothetical protein
VDLTGPRLSQIVNGKGAGCPLDVWFAMGQALELPFKAEFARDRAARPERRRRARSASARNESS